MLVASLAGGTALMLFPHAVRARTIQGGQGVPWAAGLADEPYYGLEDGTFFTAEERVTADHLTSRIIPTDDSGPGAREADVVAFIDRQLAGFYGRGQRWYMSGPFPDPLDTQGYQSEHTPAQLWRAGLAALDAHSREIHDGLAFSELDEERQDAILKAMDEGEAEFADISAKAFFEFAKEMTIEGFFCDPIYGGNRDMVAWRYVGFPGARYDYRDFVQHDGRPIEIEPVSLMGRSAWQASQ